MSVAYDERRVLGSRNFDCVGIGRRRYRLWTFTCTRVDSRGFLIAYVIAVSMTEENDVDFPKPRIVGASYCCAHVIENSDPGRVFKE